MASVIVEGEVPRCYICDEEYDEPTDVCPKCEAVVQETLDTYGLPLDPDFVPIDDDIVQPEVSTDFE